MKIIGKLISCLAESYASAEIELTPQELAEQLTNEEWDEIKLLKWQHEKPKPDKIEELKYETANDCTGEHKEMFDKLNELIRKGNER